MGLWKRMSLIIKQQKGEVALIGLVKFIILFTILGLGVEFYRLQTYHSTLQTRLEIIVQDALELSVRDEYRKERISKITATEAEDNLYEVLKMELNLDYNLRPIAPSILQYPLVITELDIIEGTFSSSGTRYYNTQYPSISIKGYTHQRIILIPFISDELKLVEIPFKIHIDNRRYD